MFIEYKIDWTEESVWKKNTHETKRKIAKEMSNWK